MHDFWAMTVDVLILLIKCVISKVLTMRQTIILKGLDVKFT